MNHLLRLRTIIKRSFKYYYLKKLPEKKYKSFLEKEYKRRTGEELSLDNPQKYTEKMQYSKLYCNSKIKTELTDKYKVRSWVSETIGDKYLIPLIGVWDSYKEINFEEMPKKFVLKTNHGAGWNLIVKDKSQINHLPQRIKFNFWIGRNFAYYNDLQLHYKDIKPKIIAEKYIVDKKGQLNDYKFLCFDGVPQYCWLDIGRYDHQYRNMYNMKWELQEWNYNSYINYPKNVTKPENFDEMINIAKKLSKGFSHVRVDLYNVDGKIYFGEMTFTSSGGYSLMNPEIYNYKLGKMWNINSLEK